MSDIEKMVLSGLKELTKDYEKANCLTIGDFPELEDEEEWEEEEEDCIRKGAK